MFKRTSCLALLTPVIVALTTSIFAETIIQSQHYDFSNITPGASSFQEYMGLDFDPFDEQGGTRTLETVTLSFSISASANVAVENNDEFLMYDVFVTSTVHLDIDNLGSASPVDMYFEESSVNLDPTDGIAGSGPDFYDYGMLSIDGFGYYDTTYHPSDLTRFIGSDPVQLVFDGSAEFDIGGYASPHLTVSDFTASLNTSLTYEYTPEPTTILLLSLGGLALRKRKNS